MPAGFELFSQQNIKLADATGITLEFMGKFDMSNGSAARNDFGNSTGATGSVFTKENVYYGPLNNPIVFTHGIQDSYFHTGLSIYRGYPDQNSWTASVGIDYDPPFSPEAMSLPFTGYIFDQVVRYPSSPGQGMELVAPDGRLAYKTGKNVLDARGISQFTDYRQSISNGLWGSWPFLDGKPAWFVAEMGSRVYLRPGGASAPWHPPGSATYPADIWTAGMRAWTGGFLSLAEWKTGEPNYDTLSGFYTGPAGLDGQELYSPRVTIIWTDVAKYD